VSGVRILAGVSFALLGAALALLLRPRDLPAPAPPPDSPAAAATEPAPSPVEPAGTVRGAVVDRDGRALPGARVAAAGVSATTDGNGAFSLPVDGTDPVDVVIAADGHATVEWWSVSADEELRVVLERGVALEFAATDEIGVPVAGLRVEVAARVFGGESGFRASGETDANGRSVLGPLPAGRWADVRASGAAAACAPYRLVRTPAEGARRIEIACLRGARIDGVVRDAASGAPVSGARVRLDARLESRAVTGGDGGFTLRGWDGESCGIVVESDVHAAVEVDAAPRVEVALDPALTVVGRVVDEDGNAIAGAAVAVRRSRTGWDRFGPSPPSAATDSEGRFEMRGVPLATPDPLVVRAPGRACGTFDLERVPRTRNVADCGDLALGSAHSVAGTFVDRTGAPLRRARITLEGFGGEPLYFAARFTDEQGRFSFDDAPDAVFRVEGSAPGVSPCEAEIVVPPEWRSVAVALQAGEHRADVVVLDDAGRPIPGAVVALGRGGASVEAMTDDEGRALFLLPEEPSRVAARYPDGDERRFEASSDQSWPRGARGMRIALRETRQVRGRLVDDEGEGVGGAAIRARAAGRETEWGRTDRSGEFAIELPASAPVALRFVARGTRDGMPIVWEAALEGQPPVGPVVVRATPLRADASVRARVLSPDGRPVLGVRVCCEGEEQLTDAAGRVAFEGLPARDVELAVVAGESNDDWVAPEPRTVASAGQSVELRFLVGVPIAGTVRLSDGSPARGAEVTASSGDRLVNRTFADSAGGFRLLVPEPLLDSYELRAARQGRFASCSISAGQADLILTLR